MNSYEIFFRAGLCTDNEHFDFGVDLYHDPDPGILKGNFYRLGEVCGLRLLLWICDQIVATTTGILESELEDWKPLRTRRTETGRPVFLCYVCYKKMARLLWRIGSTRARERERERERERCEYQIWSQFKTSRIFSFHSVSLVLALSKLILLQPAIWWVNSIVLYDCMRTVYTVLANNKINK